MRALNDRIAEAMRRERLGLIRPLWADWAEEDKADWLRRADHMLMLFKELGVFAAIEEEKRRA